MEVITERGLMLYPHMIFLFSVAEFVVGVYEDGKYGLQGFESAEETTASASQSGNIVPQVGINTFNDICITFIVNIACVFTGENHSEVFLKSVSAIFPCRRRVVHNPLKHF